MVKQSKSGPWKRTNGVSVRNPNLGCPLVGNVYSFVTPLTVTAVWPGFLGCSVSFFGGPNRSKFCATVFCASRLGVLEPNKFRYKFGITKMWLCLVCGCTTR
ncbi:hypothetical protein BV22DRAFT_329940 [Leucogyrophana mollusca]|uniref:Uncharacterized protein n=1 Tax=Leucogyrophana mollusca TaxID=85980 RepID=A0ACB8BLK5_9AGAM|nr:hypothetical protein BV22DRAFT_329940 [Leucogyrophana mollusca]